MNSTEIKTLIQIKEKCKHICIIIDNWDLDYPGTYLNVCNYLQELQEFIKPLHKIVKNNKTLQF